MKIASPLAWERALRDVAAVTRLESLDTKNTIDRVKASMPSYLRPCNSESLAHWIVLFSVSNFFET